MKNPVNTVMVNHPFPFRQLLQWVKLSRYLDTIWGFSHARKTQKTNDCLPFVHSNRLRKAVPLTAIGGRLRM